MASDVTSADELDSCLSALAELFKGFHIPGTPGVDGHPLQRLPAFLESKLPAESHNTIYNAVSILDAARTSRHARQHHGLQIAAPSQWAIFGISYPVFDCSTAWRQIQTSVAGAVDAIRNEIQGNIEDES